MSAVNTFLVFSLSIYLSGAFFTERYNFPFISGILILPSHHDMVSRRSLGVLGSWGFKRWKKWRNKCVEYESLPADAPDAQRRKTMLDLQDSVNDLILEESLNERIITVDRIRLFIDALNERRDVERRHTMPPSRAKMAWGSTRLMRGLSVPPHMWSNKDD